MHYLMCKYIMQSIRLDDLDEAYPIEAEVVPHVGPIESKMLLGSDNRLYLLEVVRLMPRDANYVAVSAAE